MFKLLKRLLGDRRGNALAIACAAMPMVVGCAGLATDTIQWTLWKRQLQRAADSAAVAGVYDREKNGGDTTNTPTAVCTDLAVNLHTWMSLQASTPCTGAVGSYSSLTYPTSASAFSSNQVAVTLRIQQSLPFSGLFMSNAPVITASATAAGISTGTPCALALNSTGTAMNYSGNSTVNAPTCILYSDSASSNSASAGGSASVTAKAIAGVGGIASSNNWHVTQYIPYSPPLPDPFASISVDPADMHCSSSGLDKSTTFPVGSTTNCWSGISTQPHDVITVPPSIKVVYVNGGSVDLHGTFNCTCTVVLTNQSTSPTAPIGTWTSNSQASNNITAPMTGNFAGIAVYQDRRASANTVKINGGSSNVIQGAVYFPNATLQINGSGEATSLCAMWVAYNITFLGNSDIAISSPDDVGCSGKEPAGAKMHMVRLVA